MNENVYAFTIKPFYSLYKAKKSYMRLYFFFFALPHSFQVRHFHIKIIDENRYYLDVFFSYALLYSYLDFDLENTRRPWKKCCFPT